MPVAQTAVTRRAVNLETVVTAFDIGFGDLDREEIDILAVLLPRVSGLIHTQLTACHRVLNSRTLRTPIVKKCRGWLCMSLRQPTRARAPENKIIMSLVLRRYNGHLASTQAAQEIESLLRPEHRVRRLNAQEELVFRGTRKLGNVENRVIGLR
jgi:hypothetical protein